MPIGDAKAQKYVIQELVRRCIGRHQLRQTQTPVPGATSDKRKLTDWWHLRTPFIRMVSNAVPHEQASKLTSEWAAATEVYGEEMTNNTRFKHILFGGTGLHNEGNKTADLHRLIQSFFSRAVYARQFRGAECLVGSALSQTARLVLRHRLRLQSTRGCQRMLHQMLWIDYYKIRPMPDKSPHRAVVVEGHQTFLI